MTLGQLIEFSRKELKDNKIDSYMIDSLMIICHELKITKEQLLRDSKSIVAQEQIDKINQSIKRRIKREPVSHIIGKRGFWEDDFIVNKDVLDPRPDSESLIESAFNLFPNPVNNIRILELGVGSGCLILTILKKFPRSFGVGVDISHDALEVAKNNAKNLELDDRITFLQSNWFDNLKDNKFDLIISNPPYIKSDDIHDLQYEVKEFEPRLALDGGEDGLDCYKIISKTVKSYLNKDGYLLLEIGQGQEDDVIKIFTKNGLEFVGSKRDLSGIIRCLIFKNESN